MPKVVKPRRFPWKLLFALAVWSSVAVSAGIAAKRAQLCVLHDGHFTLHPGPSGISIEGLHYASRARVAQMFAPDFGGSAFLVPMAERRRRLLAIDWIEDASVSRLWPNHLLVRVKERRPVAFAELASGRYLLIDSAGVLLHPPAKMKFDFPVLSGVTEEQSEEERGARVAGMSTLLTDLGARAKLISEVNAANIEDLRVTTEVNGRAVELWMGDRNFASRFEHFLHHYPEIHRNSPGAAVFDLRLDDRITTKEP